MKFIFSSTTELCETKTLSDQNTEIFFSRMLYNPQAVLLKVVKNLIKLLPKSKSKEKTKTAKVAKTFPSYLCHTLMQSEQVFGLVSTGTCTKTIRPNTTARHSMCVKNLFLIRAVAAHTIPESTSYRHEKPVADPGEGPWGPAAPLFFDQNKARRPEKFFWETWPPPYLRV